MGATTRNEDHAEVGHCGVKRCAREPLASASSDLDDDDRVSEYANLWSHSLPRIGRPVNNFMLTLRDFEAYGICR